jgi:uncharacterized RDD family membrane protein YckC
MKYAGFWIRLIAEFVDSTLLTIASFVLVFVFVGICYWVGHLTGSAQGQGFFQIIDPFWMQILDMVFYMLLAFPYYVWFHYKKGTTLGKMLFSIYVVNDKNYKPITLNQSVLRCLGYVVSGLPFLCGYLMAAFHPEKKALHDLIAGTVSVIKPKKT